MMLNLDSFDRKNIKKFCFWSHLYVPNLRHFLPKWFRKREWSILSSQNKAFLQCYFLMYTILKLIPQYSQYYTKTDDVPSVLLNKVSKSDPAEYANLTNPHNKSRSDSIQNFS